MDINGTEYLSKLPKEALTTLAKAWKSFQSGMVYSLIIMSGCVFYLVRNKDTLIPDLTQPNPDLAIADILPLVGVVIGGLLAYMIFTLLNTRKLRSKVRKVADENGLPFKDLLKEGARRQKLLKPYL